MSSRLVINLLGYLGLAPFGVSAWLIISDAYLPDFDARFLFASYSATILTFLGGVLWGRGLVNADAFARNLMLILSNFFALLAWFSLVVWHTLTPNLDLFGVCLISLALGYLLVYVAETRLAGNATIKVTWPYSKMRLVLTALVVIMHGTVFIMR